MELKKHYSAVVVGAGPGGSMAARALARAGVDVALLEKSKDVGKNFLCAEGISHTSLTQFFPVDPRYVASEVRRVRVVGPRGDDFVVRTPGAGYVLERVMFDRFLAEEAALAGAELWTSTTVQHVQRVGGHFQLDVRWQGEHRTLTADLVIGADGVSSRVGRELGLAVETEEQDVHVASQVLLVHPSIQGDRMEFYISHRWAPFGYAWVFPKRDGVGNVGLGVLPPHRAQPLLAEFLRTYFPGGRVVWRLNGAIPTGGWRMQLVDDGVMLVGDAARLADPLTDGGIATAMISGDLAGQVGAAALAEGDLSADRLRAYPETYWKRYKKYYDLNLRLRNLFFRLSDEDLAELHRILAPRLQDQSLTTYDAFELLGIFLRMMPDLLGFLARKGGTQLVGYLRSLVFPSS